MMLRWLIASLHLLALAIGFAAIWMRADAFGRRLDADGLRRLFRADAFWGVAALLWLATGIWRAFGGLEKGTSYYLHDHFFLTKLTLFTLILVLEIGPMRALIGWRIQRGRGLDPDTTRAARYRRVSLVQLVLVVAMVFAATAMARGLGAG
jgi:putative membrane protein